MKMRSAIGVQLDQMPFKMFGVKFEFKVVCEIGNREIENFLPTFVGGVNKIDGFDFVIALIPSHAFWNYASLRKRNHHIDWIVQDLVHTIF